MLWNRSHLLLILATTFCGVAGTASRVCKIIPEDQSWPSVAVWSAFNRTVGGNLIKTVPIGSPCFSGQNFDAVQCQNIKDNWTNSNLYLPSSSAMQDSIFANNSCNPFLGPDGQCIIGEYPEYAVNVSSPADVVKTINFARDKNIRLIVKNTGHDFMGRVSGHGTLSIWTHNQQELEWFDSYKDPWSNYQGPAFKAHAGVVGSRLFTEAGKRGYLVVVGECPTVGYVGGYIQAGGHSVLSGFKGMAADQVLSFEVITTTGKFINASTIENPDLFWALRGGGGGAYGVVWSVTTKAYNDVHMSVATFSFTEADNGAEKFWKAQEFYHRSTPNYTDQGAWILAAHALGTITVPAFIYPNHNLAQLTLLTAPLFKAFDSIGLNYTHTLNEYPSYTSTILALPDFQVPPVNNVQNGGRLLPRSIWQSESTFQRFLKTLRNITEQNLIINDAAFQAKLIPGNDGNSAVFPQWREVQRLFLPQAPFLATDPATKLLQDAKKLTSIDNQLNLLAPGIGAYMNEADPNDPNWKKDFYGVNYNRLLEIKNRYEPDQLLWGKISVGGDRWAVREDGRLCPV